MRKYALASVRWHAVQVALTFLATVIGVGFVTSALVLGDTVEEGLTGLIERLTGQLDIEVRGQPTGNGGPAPGLDPRLGARLATLDDVEAVVPFVAGSVLLLDVGAAPDTGGVFDFPTLAYNAPLPDSSTSSLRIVEGRWPASRGEVAVDVHTMAARGWTIDDDVEMLASDVVAQARIVGAVGLGDLQSLAGFTVVLLDYDSAVSTLMPDGRPTGFEVVARDGADLDVLVAEISALAPDTRIRTAATITSDSQRSVQRVLRLLTDGLLAFSTVSVVVAGFLVYNTFGTVVAQRAHELALLRAVGARRRQVVRLVVSESLVIGIAGALAGVGVGLVFAVVLRRVAAAIGVDVGGGLVIRPEAVATAVAVGVTIVVLTALVPAVRASRGSPVTALSGTPQPPPGKDASGSMLGVLLVGVGATGIAGGYTATLPVEAVVLAVGICLWGVLLALRAAVRPVSRLIRRMRPSPRRTLTALAGAHGAGDPARTATATGALLVALTIVVGAATLAASLQASAVRALDATLKAELSLESTTADGFADRVVEAAEALDEVAAVSPYRALSVPWASTGVVLIGAIDMDAVGPDEVYRLETVDGDLAGIAGGRDDHAILDVLSAQTLGLGIGDVLSVRMPAGSYDFPVSAVVEDLPFAEIQAVVGNRAFLELGGRSSVISGYVELAPGVTVAEGRQALERMLEGERLVSLSDSDDRRATLATAFGQLIGVVYLLLVVSVVVALLGVVNTLVLAMYERTSELALLRAIGMSRPQMRRMIRWEAAIVTATGTLLGAALGVLAGTAVAAGADRLGIAHVVVPWQHVAVAMAVTVVAGMVAGTFPARRAARMDLLEGLARR